MKQRLGQQGSMNVLLIPVILLSLLFIGAASFAVWTYNSRQDYKYNTDAKVAAAVAVNKEVVQAADAKHYAEVAKKPLTVYNGPDSYGSVKVSYPKTWSAYVDTTNSSTPLNAYFHAAYVPAIQSKQTYNLRVRISSLSYSTVLKQYTSKLKSGLATAEPYSLPKVSKIIGTRLTGPVIPDQPEGTATLILLPLRSTTLEIWTESNDYLADFNTYILPNLTFSP